MGCKEFSLGFRGSGCRGVGYAGWEVIFEVRDGQRLGVGIGSGCRPKIDSRGHSRKGYIHEGKGGACFRVQGLGLRVQSVWFKAEESGRVPVLDLRMPGLRLKAQG